MQSLISEIIDWQEEVFARATVEAVRDKLDEEAEELVDAIRWGVEPDFIADEIADTFIVAARWCKMHNKNIEDVIRAKMEINRGRTFGKELPNGDRRRIK